MFRKINRLCKYDVTIRDLVDKIDEIISMLNVHSKVIENPETIKPAIDSVDSIDSGDIIMNIHTGAMYVCTHVDLPDFIRYDVRPNRVENARAGYGDFRGETKDFQVLIKGALKRD